MNSVKKLLALVCALSLLLSLAACDTASNARKPENVVIKFCEALKNFDTAAMSSCIDGSADLPDLSESDQALCDAFQEHAQRITYTVNEPQIDGDHATVAVDFTYPDCSPILMDVLDAYFPEALELALSGEYADEEAMTDLFETILLEKLETAEPEFAETRMIFSCIKTEEGWKLMQLPDATLDLMTGRLLSSLQEFASVMEESSTAG